MFKRLSLSLLLVTSLFLGNSFYAMEEEETLEQITRRMLRRTQFMSSVTQDNFDNGQNVIDIREFEYVPTEARKRTHRNSLANAPRKIEAILEAENYPDPLRINRLLLYGAPGTGKSTLAEAMACYWGRCFIVPASILMRDRRNATLDRLNCLFSRLAKERGKKTLVIDEINKLTDNYTSDHTDANETGTALWANLDQFRLDLSFFLIGTTNETKKLPPQLQDRFMHMTVEITGKNNEKRQAIEDYIKALSIPKDPSIDARFIMQLAEKMQDFSIRNVEYLIASAKLFALLEPSKTLTPACIEKAFEEREYELEHFWDFSTPVSDEDRRHQESLKQQKELHKDQKEFQKEENKTQRKHAKKLAGRAEEHSEGMAFRSEGYSEAMADRTEVHSRLMAFRSEGHAEAMASRTEAHTRLMASRSEVHSARMAYRAEEHAEEMADRSEVYSARMADRSEEHAEVLHDENVVEDVAGSAYNSLPYVGSCVGSAAKMTAHTANKIQREEKLRAFRENRQRRRHNRGYEQQRRQEQQGRCRRHQEEPEEPEEPEGPELRWTSGNFNS